MNCHCQQYRFPHRPLSGRCQGAELFERVYREGWECGACPYCIQSTESHPYGDGFAQEQLRECNVSRSNVCPAVQAAASGREVAA